MSHRANEVRKRIAKRRRHHGMDRDRSPALRNEEAGPDGFGLGHEAEDSFHPLWNKEVFLMKILTSAVLVLLLAVLFRSESPSLKQAKNMIQTTLQTEFQFAAAANWYEKQFGKPLALLPVKGDSSKEADQRPDYALPVSGKISAEFSDDRQGIMLETGVGASVEAMTGGVVTFAGKKGELGNTVVIQHADGLESWYARLESVAVKPLEHVQAGKKVGMVTNHDDSLAGEFYFAIKQGEEFIDPKRVMNFE